MTMADQSPKALIEEGQALVHSLATKIARNLPIRVDLDDLIAYGQVGLAESARQFDPSRAHSSRPLRTTASEGLFTTASRK